MPGYQVKNDFLLTIERGSEWGVKIDTAPIALPTEDMPFNIEPNAHRINRANGVRGVHENSSWNDTFGKVPTASTSIIWTPQLLKEFLPGLLQKSTDWAAAVNVYTMFTNNYATLPSPKGTDDGYYYTLTRNSPVAGKDEYIASAVISSAKFMVHPTDNDGILKSDIELVGTGHTRNQSSAGVVTQASLNTMFKWGNIAKVAYGAHILTTDFISFEINVTNGAKLAQDLPTGEIVFPKWEVTGSFKVIANAETESLKTKCLSKNASASELLMFAFGNEVPAANGDLVLSSHAYLNGWKSEYEEGEVIEFQFEGVFGDGSKYPFQSKFFYL